MSAEVTAQMPRRIWWALVAMLAAAAMDLIDTTIVNVAAPAIRDELGASAPQIEWTVAGYALAFGVGLITGARLGDRYGRRPVFLAGVSGFVLASLVCGLAPNPDVLVAARVVQGLAAAVMIPQILTVIQVAVPAHQQAKAYAGYGATAAIGTVSGPLLGGLLISANVFELGWRPIFLINVPIGLAVLAVAAATLPDSRAPRAVGLDFAGVALLVLALLLVLYPLVEGPQLDWPGWAFALLVAAPFVLAVFVLQQRRRGATGGAPLIAPGLFSQRGFTGGVLAQVALYAGVTGFFLVFALTLQTGLGFTALRTGLTFVAWSVGIAIASAISSGLAPRLGRRLTMTGAIVMALGMVGLLLAVNVSGAAISPWGFVPGLLLAGLGMGMVAPTLVDVSLRRVDTDDAGSASGVVATAGQLGGALGVAGLGAIYFSALGPQPAGPDYLNALTATLYYEIAVLLLAAAVMLLIPSRPRSHRARDA
ncbi:MAG: MFS transporter [Pseudonocardia sp.]|nr:MFS transporter [Pseudonocardia sp.]